MALTTISSNGDTLPLRALPLRYDKADSEQSARALVIALNPEWAQTPGSIEFVRFKDGITNTVRTVYHEKLSWSLPFRPQQPTDRPMCSYSRQSRSGLASMTTR